MAQILSDADVGLGAPALLSDADVGLAMPAQPAQSQSPGMVNGLVRSAAEGIPIVGGLLPKLDAATNAAFSYVFNPLFNEKDQLTGSFGDRYQQALKDQI